tara:strand:+ start:224 stop:496 length:273 start_codon:yes stop_codon:yes gene_type:complete
MPLIIPNYNNKISKKNINTLTPPSKQISINNSTNNHTFTSNNQKFQANIIYDDEDDTVIMYTIINWEDPVSKNNIQKLNKEVFILKEDYM